MWTPIGICGIKALRLFCKRTLLVVMTLTFNFIQAKIIYSLVLFKYLLWTSLFERILVFADDVFLNAVCLHDLIGLVYPIERI
jgi:hypothetical protein